MHRGSLTLVLSAGALLVAAQMGALNAQSSDDGHDHEHAEKKDPATIAAERDSLMNVVLESIKGREKEPAAEVFKNLKIDMLKAMPAGRIPRMMNMGFARSLGVSCDHCHTVGEWDKDSDHKDVARDMFAMVMQLNQEILPGIEKLDSERPTVNCTTCHRGDTKPATNLDG